MFCVLVVAEGGALGSKNIRRDSRHPWSLSLCFILQACCFPPAIGNSMPHTAPACRRGRVMAVTLSI
jgi:hypothetical protein